MSIRNRIPLPDHVSLQNPQEPPPLENEPPHRKVARLTKEHQKVTAALRELKERWKLTNLKAQQTRTPVPTTLITHIETQRRELHLQLERLQAEIGATNKLIRERKATVNGSAPASRPGPKLMAYKNDPEFPIYFLLAAKDTLAPALFEQVVRMAKSLMHDGRKMGIE